MNWDEPPTEEFARYTNNPSIRYLRTVDHWFTLMKAVMNDLYFDVPESMRYLTRKESDDLMHKLYYCWKMMGRDLYGDDEE